MKKLLSILIVLSILATNTVFAVDTSIEAGKTKKTDKERSQSIKKSQEEKVTEGKKKADTTTTGVDKQTQQTIKELSQAMNDTSMHIEISLQDIVFPLIAEFEQHKSSFYLPALGMNIKEARKKISEINNDFYTLENFIDPVSFLFITDSAINMLEDLIQRGVIKRSDLFSGDGVFARAAFWHVKDKDGVVVIARGEDNKPRLEICSPDDIDNKVVKNGAKCGDLGWMYASLGFTELEGNESRVNMPLAIYLDNTFRNRLFAFASKFGVSREYFDEYLDKEIISNAKFNAIFKHFSKSCKVVTKQLMVADVFPDLLKPKSSNPFEQLTERMMIVGANQALREQALANMSLAKAPSDIVNNYKDCLAYYGAIIGQTTLNMLSNISGVATVSQNEKGEQIINGIGFNDMVSIVKSSFRKTALYKNKNRVVSDERIYSLYKRIISNAPCRFAGSETKFQCGDKIITIGENPSLVAQGIQWYGNGKFAGLNTTFKISNAWSYQNAIERLKTTAKYSKWAEEVSKYAEELESVGKAKEATLVRKKAWEIAKSGKQTVSPTSLLSLKE